MADSVHQDRLEAAEQLAKRGGEFIMFGIVLAIIGAAAFLDDLSVFVLGILLLVAGCGFIIFGVTWTVKLKHKTSPA